MFTSFTQLAFRYPSRHFLARMLSQCAGIQIPIASFLCGTLFMILSMTFFMSLGPKPAFAGEAAQKTLMVLTVDGSMAKDRDDILQIHNRLMAETQENLSDRGQWHSQINDPFCMSLERCQQTYRGQGDIQAFLIFSIGQDKDQAVIGYVHHKASGELFSKDLRTVPWPEAVPRLRGWIFQMVAPPELRSGVLVFDTMDEGVVCAVDGIVLSREEIKNGRPLTSGVHRVETFWDKDKSHTVMVEIGPGQNTKLSKDDLQPKIVQATRGEFSLWPAAVSAGGAAGLFVVGVGLAADLLFQYAVLQEHIDDLNDAEVNIVAVARQPEIQHARENIYIDSWMLTTVWGSSAMFALATGGLAGYYFYANADAAMED
jgi:hypothetical protein